MTKRAALSNRRPRAGELDWNTILHRAKEIVESYDTGVTLRQLYYRLVSEGLIPNRQQSYKTLSAKSAQARREGWFPSLIDKTREIERYWLTFDSPRHSLNWLERVYRRKRDEHQEWSIYLGVEKHGLTVQLVDWFTDLGIPVMALGGYSSQTFVDEVSKDVADLNRKSVLLYAGDFDPSGMDIDRDFVERTEIFDEVVRVALTAEIVDAYDLPPMMGKASDSRASEFVAKHGELVQVELDALPPDDLRRLYQEAIDEYFDNDAHTKSVKQEKKERKQLVQFMEETDKSPLDRALGIIGDLNDPIALEDLTEEIRMRISELD